ncbi:MAG: cobyrinate a,c-diamide synthase, partial [Candidatus Electrothrix sp. AR4]|nr:cobyrinate a,c-diamide synthase [Candidatus Electrothrix sp. AR4]
MCGPEYVRQLFYTHAPSVDDQSGDGKAVSVIEGVMGLFDGGTGSAASLASLLDIPVILVVDVRSAAESVAAVVKGFESLDPQVRVAGVIFNRVGSERHLQMVTDAVKQYCQATIIGSLPRDNAISLPSRHLGLHMGTEIELNRQRLINLLEEHLDLDLLLELSEQAAPQKIAQVFRSESKQSSPALSTDRAEVRIGVAWDEAFCFYYQDNLDMLEDAGAKIVVFSPLHDEILPENLDGLYLGGGYPELHAATLAANDSMRVAVLAFSRSGKPVYAECGGFMYLTKAIIAADGQSHPMVGVYPAVSRMGKGLRRLGYRQVKMQAETILGTLRIVSA